MSIVQPPTQLEVSVSCKKAPRACPVYLRIGTTPLHSEIAQLADVANGPCAE